MNKLNASVIPLVGLSVLLSLSALIAVAAHWPNPGNPSAPATTVARPPASLQTVRVVMHDPGRHWFQTAAGMKRSLHVNGSGVKLLNLDEASLKVAGVSGTKLERVGGTLRLQRGNYRITMVGQKPDDNTLSLVVS